MQVFELDGHQFMVHYGPGLTWAWDSQANEWHAESSQVSGQSNHGSSHTSDTSPKGRREE